MDHLTNAQRRSLSGEGEKSMLDETMKDEIIELAFLSAQIYTENIARGLAKRSLFEALEDTKKSVKLIINY